MAHIMYVTSRNCTQFYLVNLINVRTALGILYIYVYLYIYIIFTALVAIMYSLCGVLVHF